MRTLVQLRRLMDTNRDLARKIEALEKKYDEQFADVFAAIKELVAPPATPRNRIMTSGPFVLLPVRSSLSGFLIKYKERAA